MKRSDVVKSLVKEGLSEKTLVNFSDKQLMSLKERIIVKPEHLGNPNIKNLVSDPNIQVQVDEKSSDNMTMSWFKTEMEKKLGRKVTDKEVKAAIKKLIDTPVKRIDSSEKQKEINETKSFAGLSKEKKSKDVKKVMKGDDTVKKSKGFQKIKNKAEKSGAKNSKSVATTAILKNVKEGENFTKNVINDDSIRKNSELTKKWIKSLAENTFHSFTSKNEIMELIKTKLNEVEMGPIVKKLHNSIPEFMTYDSIKKSNVAKTQDAMESTKTKPKTKPKTTPKTNPGDKPKTPYQPGPGKNPKPKALKESK